MAQTMHEKLWEMEQAGLPVILTTEARQDYEAWKKASGLYRVLGAEQANNNAGVAGLNVRVNQPIAGEGSVIQEAQGVIYGNREEIYGHPAKNLRNIAEQWSLYLEQSFGVKIHLSAEDVCWMMCDLKKARQMNSRKRDNLVDAIGYIGLIERV
jgi:hypothetical protein